MTTLEESPLRLGSAQHSFAELPKWETIDPRAYQCRVLLIPEEEGGYSAHCLRLPGVVSEGETIEEAIGSIADAFREAIRCYWDSSVDVPWQDIEINRPRGSVERWILVNV